MDDLIVRVREILSTTPDRWRKLTDSVEPGLLVRPSAPGEWSASQCLQHILDTEIGALSVRIDAFLAGGDLAAFNPDADGSRPDQAADPKGVAARFTVVRAGSLEKLDRLADTDLERTAHHAEYGQVTLREMLNEWAAHDLMHTVQAERALMQPFIAGSGKWRSTFADHDAERHS